MFETLFFEARSLVVTTCPTSIRDKFLEYDMYFGTYRTFNHTIKRRDQAVELTQLQSAVGGAQNLKKLKVLSFWQRLIIYPEFSVYEVLGVHSHAQIQVMLKENDNIDRMDQDL